MRFRWFFYASNPAWNPTRHSLRLAFAAQQRELPLKLRNVYAFFTIYADIDGFDPSSDVECRAGRKAARERAIDRPLDPVGAGADQCGSDPAHGRLPGLRCDRLALTRLVDALSNWYVRRCRNRFWASGLGPDKLDAHWTLYECLVANSRNCSLRFFHSRRRRCGRTSFTRPFPMRSKRAFTSADYPEPEIRRIIDRGALFRAMGAVRDLVSLGLQVRTAHKLRVRQPLEAAELVLAEPDLESDLGVHLDLIRDELNVREVHFVPNADDYVTYQVTPNFRALGPRVGKSHARASRRRWPRRMGPRCSGSWRQTAALPSRSRAKNSFAGPR